MNGDAVRRYKELAGGNTEAMHRMRDFDRMRVEQLRESLAEDERALAQVTERGRVARMGVRLHWEAAVEALWEERWLSVGPQPEPGPATPGVDLLTADTEVGRSYDALREALRKPALLPRRHSSS